MAHATRHHPNPGSGPKRHDPHQCLTAAQARRRPAPPATAQLHPRPLEPTPRTAHRTDLGQPEHARPLAAPRLSRSLCQPSALAPPSTLSLSAVGNHQIPIDRKAEPGLRGFLPWRLSDAGPRRCPLPPDRPSSETLHSRRRVAPAPQAALVDFLPRQPAASTAEVIKQLSPVIRGWCNYYRYAVWPSARFRQLGPPRSGGSPTNGPNAAIPGRTGGWVVQPLLYGVDQGRGAGTWWERPRQPAAAPQRNPGVAFR